jgi:hypothetical protein
VEHYCEIFIIVVSDTVHNHSSLSGICQAFQYDAISLWDETQAAGVTDYIDL